MAKKIFWGFMYLLAAALAVLAVYLYVIPEREIYVAEKIEGEKANVIKDEVKLKEDDKDYSYEKAFGHKRKEEEDDPLAKTPSAETSTVSEEKSKNPSVRKEIEKIRVEMEAEEKAEKIRKQNKQWKGKGSADEAKVKYKNMKMAILRKCAIEKMEIL